MDSAHVSNRRFPGYTLAQLKDMLSKRRYEASALDDTIKALETEIHARETGERPEFVTPQVEAPASSVSAFGQALDLFLAAAQAKVDEYNKQWTHMAGKQELLTVTRGPKRIKVVKARSGVYCFIDVATGNVLKAESWSKAHATPRSNIFDADHGAIGVNWHGAVYIR